MKDSKASGIQDQRDSRNYSSIDKEDLAIGGALISSVATLGGTAYAVIENNSYDPSELVDSSQVAEYGLEATEVLLNNSENIKEIVSSILG